MTATLDLSGEPGRLVLLEIRPAGAGAAVAELVRDATAAGWQVDVLHPTGDELLDRLVRVVGTEGGTRVVLCAPRHDDIDPDLRAVGRAAAVAALRTDARLLVYAGHELLVADRAAVDDTPLEEVHRERSDPWSVDSFYERRKRAVTLAALPAERYHRALEVGCSIGALAVDLATRADRLLAVDSSPTALAAARERARGLGHVALELVDVRTEWPDGGFDLIVLSEVGYFLSPRQLGAVADRALASLDPGGHLLLCHWRHQPDGWPLAGPAVHSAFLDRATRVVVEHQEDDFLLHALGHE